jgi:hypothetical protein
MGIVLLCLILGLAIAIERIIFLNLSTTNSKKLTRNVEEALASGKSLDGFARVIGELFRTARPGPSRNPNPCSYRPFMAVEVAGVQGEIRRVSAD